MASNVKLLPMPANPFGGCVPAEEMRKWCRACVEANTEALRAEVDEWRQAAITQSGEMFREKDRAERLAEAGRRVTAAFRAHGEASPFTRQAERTRHECEAAMLALDAALEQEEGK